VNSGTTQWLRGRLVDGVPVFGPRLSIPVAQETWPRGVGVPIGESVHKSHPIGRWVGRRDTISIALERMTSRSALLLHCWPEVVGVHSISCTAESTFLSESGYGLAIPGSSEDARPRNPVNSAHIQVRSERAWSNFECPVAASGESGRARRYPPVAHCRDPRCGSKASHDVIVHTAQWLHALAGALFSWPGARTALQ
jgi:hypothetical protein